MARSWRYDWKFVARMPLERRVRALLRSVVDTLEEHERFIAELTAAPVRLGSPERVAGEASEAA